MNFHFQYKNFAWLWLSLLALLLLFAAFLYWKKKVRERIGNEKLVNALTRNCSAGLFTGKFILVCIAFAAGILAAMNPGKTGGAENIKRKGIDIAVAIDVSKSMLAADLAPNRLERAKQFVSRLMDEMPDDRIALILFAGKAYMQMPLTTDHGAAKLFVSAASPDAVPQQGTVISDALEMSARAFSTTDKRFKTIVLISDGEDHDYDAEKKAKDLSDQGIMINTVGVGSPEGSAIPDPATGENKKDASGNTIISRLNDAVLKSVAEKTNGRYINLQGSDAAVTAVKAQLSQIERKAFGDMSLMGFRTFYIWLAAAMFLLLLAENFIPERKKLTG
ncbi:MAG: VWA domain-containing protein [Bacteroidota bacterium]